jgi:hypothetical protein
MLSVSALEPISVQYYIVGGTGQVAKELCLFVQKGDKIGWLESTGLLREKVMVMAYSAMEWHSHSNVVMLSQ